jgi:hypothetical protein
MLRLRPVKNAFGASGAAVRTRFTEATMNPLAREMQYAVRGAIVTRADQVNTVDFFQCVLDIAAVGWIAAHGRVRRNVAAGCRVENSQTQAAVSRNYLLQHWKPSATQSTADILLSTGCGGVLY